MYFDEGAITAEVLGILADRYHGLRRLLYADQSRDPTLPPALAVRGCIHRLVTYANGGAAVLDECGGEDAMMIDSADLLEYLFPEPPGCYQARKKPDEFPHRQSYLLAVRLIESVDWELWVRAETVSYTEAAAILYADYAKISRNTACKRVHRLVARGELEAYRDPGERNPRHAQRVLRAAVAWLRTQRDKAE